MGEKDGEMQKAKTLRTFLKDLNDSFLLFSDLELGACLERLVLMENGSQDTPIGKVLINTIPLYPTIVYTYVCL